MPRFKETTIVNPWYNARKEHSQYDPEFGSRLGLADDTGIDRRRLAMIEAGTSDPTPEEARLIALSCGKPDLQYYYCSEVCPLGRNLPKIVEEQPEATAAQLAISCGKLSDDRDILLQMLSDGRVDENDAPLFQQIVSDMDVLEAKYKNLAVQLERRMNEHEKRSSEEARA